MSLQHILLGMLERPASGYSLKAEFDEGARYFWGANISQIYPTLHRMEERGLLSSHVEPPDQGPPRRIYRRTAAGQAELEEWLSQDPIVGTERFAYIAQLVFMHELHDFSRSLGFVKTLRSKLDAVRLRLLEAESGMLKEARGSVDDMDEEALHSYICVRMGVRSYSARVDACDEMERLLLERIEKKERIER